MKYTWLYNNGKTTIIILCGKQEIIVKALCQPKDITVSVGKKQRGGEKGEL